MPTTPLDPYRLPTSVVPRRYDLVLEPDLEAARFDGTVRIRLEVLEPAAEVVLNVKELDLGEASLHAADGETVPLTCMRFDAGLERVAFELGNSLAPGVYDLTIAFRGTLNDKLAGFYRSTFVDEAGARRTIATTQLQATDARRAFPCFDEPALKAVFGVTLVVPEDLLAVSNAPVLAEEPAGDGRRRVAFADTPVMSTYLLAFVVGPLAATATVDVDGVALRVVHAPGKGHLARFALEVGAFSLRYFADYYGIPYPGKKLDLLAVPDFAFGAMENWGCVIFREVLLLVDEARATQPELSRVADVIAHEIAHMWFGDLVTMRWWNGTWLNEAFATFMEVRCGDAFRPEWRRWDQFSRERTAAFDVDALAKSRPIEIEVRSPADAEAMFDVLTYEKGASVVRMLEQYLGEDRFREGVRCYLKRHAYGNTETTDLWDAIEEIVGEPVRRIMDAWIFQPGFPLLSASVSPEGGALQVRQERFLYLPSDEGRAARWPVPLVVRGGGELRKALLDAPEAELAAGPGTLLNAGGHGFYRVRYAPELLAVLAGRMMDDLVPVERYTLVDDAWASTLAGALPAAEFLAFAERFGDETDLDVWAVLSGGLEALGRILDGSAKSAYEGRLRGLYAPALSRLGWEPAPASAESSRTRELRALLARNLAVAAADPDALARCRALHGAYLTDAAAVEPNLAAAAAAAVASRGSAADYDAFLTRVAAAATPQEERRYRFLTASFPGDAEMERTLAASLDSTVRSQDAPYLVGLCLENRDQGAAAWAFLRAHWVQMLAAYPDNAIVRMLSGVRTLSRPDTAAEVLSFFDAHPVPKGQRTLDQHLEKLRVNVALREREGPRLSQHLLGA